MRSCRGGGLPPTTRRARETVTRFVFSPLPSSSLLFSFNRSRRRRRRFRPERPKTERRNGSLVPIRRDRRVVRAAAAAAAECTFYPFLPQNVTSRPVTWSGTGRSGAGTTMLTAISIVSETKWWSVPVFAGTANPLRPYPSTVQGEKK